MCDRITVLRDGRFVDTFERECRVARRHRAGDGRPLDSAAAAGAVPQRPAKRLVCASSEPDSARDASRMCRSRSPPARSSACSDSSARAGPSSSRRSPACSRADRGSIAVDGRLVRARSPRAAARAGVVLVPEDRQRQGLCFNLSLRHNLVLPAAATRGDAADPRIARSRPATRSSATWRIAAPSTAITPDSAERRQPAEDRRSPSGSRSRRACCCSTSRPKASTSRRSTRSTASSSSWRRAGTAVLLVSSDLPEVLALADRVLVMREGRLRGELARRRRRRAA